MISGALNSKMKAVVDENMEESYKRIIKISRIIQYTTAVAMALFGLFALGGIGIAVYPYDAEMIVSFHRSLIDSVNLLPSDLIRSFMGEDHLRLQVILTGVFIFLFGILLVYLIHEYRKIFKKITSSRSPFTRETSGDFRKLSNKALLICLFSTLLGLALFLLLRLFAYIFEYGAYLQDKADETSRIQEEMIMSLAEITENKSEQTGKHVRRVAEYSLLMAEEMGIDEDEAKMIRLASTMHDIGKLLIPDSILEKPARLTDEEFAVIKKHPGYGGDLLNNVEGDVMRMARTVALEHHERPDGRGYPEGKKGNSLSIEGRIVAVADVYDALTSNRSYKKAWDEKDAYEEIVKGRGTQFDEGVIDAFIKAYPKINAVREKLQE